MIKSIQIIKSLSTDFMMLLFFYVFVAMVFQNHEIAGLVAEVPNIKFLLLTNTIFLGIVLEALPFLLIGALVTGVVQLVIKPGWIQKILPKNQFSAILTAVLVSFILPVCECTSIPFITRLLRKGLPQHLGVLFIMAAPIVNPITLVSTYLAFRSHMIIFYGRIVFAITIAVIISILTKYGMKDSSILLEKEKEIHREHLRQSIQPASTLVSSWFTKLQSIMNHATDDFFEAGKYVVVGALFAAFYQTGFNQNLVKSVTTNHAGSTLAMMALSFLMSLCSQADGFVASSFTGKFPTESLLAFLVFGPVLDLKTTWMLIGAFKKKFVLTFVALFFSFTFVLCMLFQYLMH